MRWRAGLISRFRTAYPHVELSLNEQTTSRLLEALKGGALELAFLRPGLNETDGLNLRRLPDEDLWAALPAGHRLAGETRINLVELAGDPFILYASMLHSGIALWSRPISRIVMP
jgi:DNA-binding transcriptional LysR family regulator